MRVSQLRVEEKREGKRGGRTLSVALDDALKVVCDVYEPDVLEGEECLLPLCCLDRPLSAGEELDGALLREGIDVVLQEVMVLEGEGLEGRVEGKEGGMFEECGGEGGGERGKAAEGELLLREGGYS